MPNKSKRHLKLYLGTAGAVIAFLVWASPRLLQLREDWTIGTLERVNVIAASELFGAEVLESCSLDYIDAEVKVFDLGVLVKVRGETSRQVQFFPKNGVDAFLASRSLSFLPIASAYAKEAEKKPARKCEEQLIEFLPETRQARYRCVYPNGCVEVYLVELATGSIVTHETPPCPTPPE
jgi:hypothetical protein